MVLLLLRLYSTMLHFLRSFRSEMRAFFSIYIVNFLWHPNLSIRLILYIFILVSVAAIKKIQKSARLTHSFKTIITSPLSNVNRNLSLQVLKSATKVGLNRRQQEKQENLQGTKKNSHKTKSRRIRSWDQRKKGLPMKAKGEHVKM